MADLPEKIPQHRHCRHCGKAFIGDGEFCSDECKSYKGGDAKKRLRKLLLAWLVIVCVTAVIAVIYFLS